MDAWSTGVLVCMVLCRTDASPFSAEADWRLGLFSDRDAVAARTADVFSDFSSFLLDVDAKSRGLLFRHGWLVEVLLSVGINHWSRPAWDIFKPLYLAQIELVFHDS